MELKLTQTETYSSNYIHKLKWTLFKLYVHCSRPNRGWVPTGNLPLGIKIIITRVWWGDVLWCFSWSSWNSMPFEWCSHQPIEVWNWSHCGVFLLWSWHLSESSGNGEWTFKTCLSLVDIDRPFHETCKKTQVCRKTHSDQGKKEKRNQPLMQVISLLSSYMWVGLQWLLSSL